MKSGYLTKILDSAKINQSEPRDYIGASIIGSDCLRQIWYEFKGFRADNVSPKLERTFSIGKSLEELILFWLCLHGLKFEQNLLEIREKSLPIFKGTPDAVLNDKTILEIKTAKAASFKIFKEKGLRVWNYRYYCQIQSYMGMSGLNNAIMLVLNKDTSDIWDELVKFDVECYDMLVDKARLISEYEEPAPRVNESLYWFQCKTCMYRKTCGK